MKELAREIARNQTDCLRYRSRKDIRIGGNCRINNTVFEEKAPVGRDTCIWGK